MHLLLVPQRQQVPSATTALDTRKLEDILFFCTSEAREFSAKRRQEIAFEILAIKRNVACRSIFALNLEVQWQVISQKNPTMLADFLLLLEQKNPLRFRLARFKSLDHLHRSRGARWLIWTIFNEVSKYFMKQSKAFHLCRQILWSFRFASAAKSV